MLWLRHRVTLTLLIDLLSGSGPDSQALDRDERADTAWLCPQAA